MILGPVEEELAKAGAAYRNRGRWGEDDALGTLNFVDDAIRAHAASLVRRGRAFSLAQGTDRAGAQVVTRWQGLGRGDDTGQGLRGACTGRGVLLDVGRAVGDPRGELPDGFPVLEEHLRETVEAQGATSSVRRGDLVLVRTGQLGRVRRQGTWDRYAAGDAPGLSFTTLGWLHRTEIAAVATDTCGLEVRPSGFTGPVSSPLHRVAVPHMGLPLGEMWDLETLSADCAADGVYEFLLVAAPLPVTGAAGFPVNPIAVK
ncbi:cyclase family protein [Streptomyces sp. NPDC090499]|uniref:cyclase family protein n=1 Tax=Streptomyces sp. NPDC090499 TaxID=3365965 RepID=UPI00380105CF